MSEVFAQTTRLWRHLYGSIPGQLRKGDYLTQVVGHNPTFPPPLNYQTLLIH